MHKDKIVAFVMEHAESTEDMAYVAGEITVRSMKQAMREALDEDDKKGSK